MKKILYLLILLSAFSCTSDQSAGKSSEKTVDNSLVRIETSIIDEMSEGNTLQKTVAYKILENRKLQVLMYIPGDLKPGEKRPSVTIFHSGGWFSGDYKNMKPYAQEFVDRGYITFSVQYRLARTDKLITIEECVKDAKSFLKWLYINEEALQLDREKIIFSGFSAGGHLAAATLFIDEFNDEAGLEDIKPNGLILFSSALNLDLDDWAKGLIREDQDIIALSPSHRIKPTEAPTLILHGEQDEIASIDSIYDFQEEMEKAGNICELKTYDVNHGDLYKNKEIFQDSISESEQFLIRHGFNWQE
ncbi:MAG: alpha/beta hydrolase [Spirochaetales bacterium]|nr:alpha/beta hydrolase [Spirochaetales bacterium]